MTMGDVDELLGSIKELLIFEIWDDKTKASLDAYLKLRGISYLAEDRLSSGGELRIAIKMDGKIHHFLIGGAMVP